MTYLPSSEARIMALKDVRSVAYGLLIQGGSEPVLITGGKSAHAMFLTGPRQGHGFLLDDTHSDIALVIENVEIEIDLSSNFLPAFIEQPIGAIKYSQNSSGVCVFERGRHSLTDIDFLDGVELRGSPSASLAGFKTWKIVKAIDDRRTTLLEYTSNAVANF